MEQTASGMQGISIQMLGGFSISQGARQLHEEAGRRRKIWNLLQYLIVNRSKEVPIESLFDLVAPDDGDSDPMGVLKNLVYRVRKLLRKAGLPPDLVVSRGGSYRWNPQAECSVDIEQMEADWQVARKSALPEEERSRACWRIVDRYAGRMLPEAQSEDWVAPLTAYYHRIYTDCVRDLSRRLLCDRKTEPVLRLCRKALSIDPYDEQAHLLMIRAQLEGGNYQDALAAYNSAVELLYNGLGVSPGEEVRRLYREILKSYQGKETDIETIRQELCEDVERHGAYHCEYEVFKNVYRIMQRNQERTGQPLFMLAFTLTPREHTMPDAKQLAGAMLRLREAISVSLRKGDLYARYSNCQYVVLLPGASSENGRVVAQRITRRFRSLYLGRQIELNYQLRPLESVEQPAGTGRAGGPGGS